MERHSNLDMANPFNHNTLASSPTVKAEQPPTNSPTRLLNRVPLKTQPCPGKTFEVELRDKAVTQDNATSNHPLEAGASWDMAVRDHVLNESYAGGFNQLTQTAVAS